MLILRIVWFIILTIGVLALLAVSLLMAIVVGGGYHEGVVGGPLSDLFSAIMVMLFIDPVIAAMFWGGLVFIVAAIFNLRRLSRC